MKNIYTLISAILIALLGFSNPANAQWQQTNGPDDYNVFCFTISGNNVFAGTSQGAYVSSNNGASWTGIDNGLGGFGYVTSLASSGSTIYAGTIGGVYSSTDNGNDWNAAGLDYYDITSLATGGDTVFAGTAGDGVQMSTNSGGSWTALNNGIPAFYNAITSLLIKGNVIFAGCDSGVYISQNRGLSWTAVNNGISKNDTVYSLANIGNYIFAGSDRGVYLTTNNGASWTAVNNGLTPSYVNCLAINGDTIFAGVGTWGGGIYFSVNNGTSWTAINNGFPKNSIVYGLAVKGNYLFGGVWGDGIYSSSNGGTSWAAVSNNFDANTIVNTLFSKGDTILAGTEGNGIYLSDNNGATWSAANNGDLSSEAPILCFASSGNNIFAGTGNLYSTPATGGVFLSTDNGNSWTHISNGLPTEMGVYSLAISGNNIFAGMGGDGVFMSTNNGTSWTHVSTGLPDNFVGDTVISALAIKGDTIFAGNEINGVYISTNNGANWSWANSGFPLSNSSLYPSVGALAVIGNKVFAAANTGLYLSTGISIHWKIVDSPTISSPGTLYVAGDTIFISTGGGVFISTDTGTSWTEFNDGFPVSYTSGTFAVVGSTVFGSCNNSGNAGLGVWSRSLSVTTGINTAETNSVDNISIYPNPTNGKFFVGNSSNVKSITVYNLLGECIYTSLSAPAASPITINLSSQPKGMYFIELQTTARIINKKVTIN